MDWYLKEMTTRRIEPNFWCSREYLKHAGAVEKVNGDLVWIEDPDTGDLLFPAMSLTKGLVAWSPDNRAVWSDFYGGAPFRTAYDWRPEMLDREFIYDPVDFLNLKGGKWKVFRKNVRKWPRRNEGSRYVHLNPTDTGEGKYYNAISALVLKWLDTVGEGKVHDGNVLVKFCLYGCCRAVLLRGDEVVGLNVWDFSPGGRINFRFTISLPDEPFLSDYLRLLFYTDKPVVLSDKWVNDGGCLDNDGLERYKRKLNPIRTRVVNGWTKKGEQDEC